MGQQNSCKTLIGVHEMHTSVSVEVRPCSCIMGSHTFKGADREYMVKTTDHWEISNYQKALNSTLLLTERL